MLSILPARPSLIKYTLQLEKKTKLFVFLKQKIVLSKSSISLIQKSALLNWFSNVVCRSIINRSLATITDSMFKLTHKLNTKNFCFVYYNIELE